MNPILRILLGLAVVISACAANDTHKAEDQIDAAQDIKRQATDDREDATDTENATDSDGYTTGTWCGEAKVGFEQQSFRPCGTSERWWLGSGPVGGGRSSCDGPSYYSGCSSYACVSGTLSPPKAIPHTGYGHLGMYARELIVSEILEQGVQTEEKCPHPAQP